MNITRRASIIATACAAFGSFLKAKKGLATLKTLSLCQTWDGTPYTVATFSIDESERHEANLLKKEFHSDVYLRQALTIRIRGELSEPIPLRMTISGIRKLLSAYSNS